MEIVFDLIQAVFEDAQPVFPLMLAQLTFGVPLLDIQPFVPGEPLPAPPSPPTEPAPSDIAAQQQQQQIESLIGNLQSISQTEGEEVALEVMSQLLQSGNLSRGEEILLENALIAENVMANFPKVSDDIVPGTNQTGSEVSGAFLYLNNAEGAEAWFDVLTSDAGQQFVEGATGNTIDLRLFAIQNPDNPIFQPLDPSTKLPVEPVAPGGVDST